MAGQAAALVEVEPVELDEEVVAELDEAREDEEVPEALADDDDELAEDEVGEDAKEDGEEELADEADDEASEEVVELEDEVDGEREEVAVELPDELEEAEVVLVTDIGVVEVVEGFAVELLDVSFAGVVVGVEEAFDDDLKESIARPKRRARMLLSVLEVLVPLPLAAGCALVPLDEPPICEGLPPQSSLNNSGFEAVCKRQ
jgi:hypothetical protein